MDGGTEMRTRCFFAVAELRGDGWHVRLMSAVGITKVFDTTMNAKKIRRVLKQRRR